MQKEVEQYIRSLSDIDLLEYSRTDTYLPEAVQFAKEELARRNLTSECLVATEKELGDRTKTGAEQRQRHRSHSHLSGVLPFSFVGYAACFRGYLSWHRGAGSPNKVHAGRTWICGSFACLGSFPR